MSNLNLDLIEKVRKGEAAIEHTQFKEDNDKLKSVLLKAFPTSELAHYPFEEKYYGKAYIGTKKDDWDIYVMGEEQTMEIIPLQSFFTNQLTPEDNKTIELIDERLKKLEVLLDDALDKETPESLKEWLASKRQQPTAKQPTAKDEVESIGDWNGNLTKGKRYAVREMYQGNYVIKNDSGVISDYEPKYFNVPNQAQQQVEYVKERWLPKFGDRYYTIDLVGTGIDIRQRMWADKTTDYNNSELGNFFKTEAEAIAQKIKNLLKN